MSEDEDGRLFAIPSSPPAKLPHDSERKTLGPQSPTVILTSVMSQFGHLILAPVFVLKLNAKN